MGNYSTASYTEVTTGPSIILSGYTFYSGNVYLSIPEAGAYDTCASHRGSTYSNIMLTLASSDVFSGRAGAYGYYPIDYADFNTPYPWSAYKGALHACNSGMNIQPGPECSQSTVFNDQFHPVLNIPISIQHLDPDWKGCRPIDALVDPPVALQSRTPFIATQPAPHVTTSAQPVPVPENPPAQTSVPDPKQTGGMNNPNDPHDPQDPGVGENTKNGAQPTKAADPPTVIKPPVVTIGPSTFPIVPDPSGNGGGLVVNLGTTIQKGGPAATVGGTTVSVGHSGITISDASGTRTVPVPKGDSNGNGNGDQGGGVISIGGEIFTVASRGNLVKFGTTIKIGDPIMTINGMAVSVGANGIVVVDPTTRETKTIPFVEKEGLEMITAGDKIMSIAADGGLVLGPGTTLHAGDAAVTVDGTVVSVGKGGEVTVVDPSGKTTAVDTKGMTTISDEKGVKTILDPNGATTIVDSSGKTTIMDSSGATTIMVQGGSKTIIDQNGNTMIMDSKGSTSLVGAAGKTAAAESTVTTGSPDPNQNNNGPAASATHTSNKGEVGRGGLNGLMIFWCLGVWMFFLCSA
ncbi:hypothetical protein K469DRAFT_708764 [Zopfia rhizophila CBS 207.26]|uniref:Uncharacterized protein n=1 Tax=Zopfia rhizophila CBS 207.26 TaxID=1314779 RepID=A0A6A6E1J8_9PEZI|nr:hypothetical protein K469DRAFT_708764 [Zopfia rhizophila CBS 207.26]